MWSRAATAIMCIVIGACRIIRRIGHISYIIIGFGGRGYSYCSLKTINTISSLRDIIRLEFIMQINFYKTEYN